MSLAQQSTVRPELVFSRFSDQLAPFVEAAGLEPDFFTDPEFECSVHSFVKLLELAGCSTDESIGLRLGEQVRSEDFGVVGQALRSMEKLEDVLLGIGRYLVVRTQSVKFDVDVLDALVAVSYRITDPTIIQRRQDAEFTLAAMLSCWREVTASALIPERVDFEHPRPKDLSLHRAFFHCPLRFGQDSNRLYFSKTVLDLPVHTSNRRLLQALRPFLEDQCKLRNQSSGLLSKVSQAIAAELGTGGVGVIQVAGALHMSVRTLQRRLSGMNLEFGVLVEDVRRALALEYVGNSSYRLTDVALMLGYAEASSFTRAFRRWTGVAPRDYRSAMNPDA